MDKLLETISNMPPEEALSQITDLMGQLLSDLDSDSRERFVMKLLEQSKGDKVSSLVHL
ncbi:MAG: hypothetical protein R6X11_09815 [Desulfonatronovibrio sp.]